MSQALSASLRRFCSQPITYMATALMEWSQYLTDKIRDEEEVSLWRLAQAACARLVYFNLLTVFFFLYFELSWEEFISLRRHRDRIFYLVQLASAFENGGTDLADYKKLRDSQQIRSGSIDAQLVEHDYCSRLALYVSGLGEQSLQGLVMRAENSHELIAALEKTETFTSHGSILRIWYGLDRESIIRHLLFAFVNNASGDDYRIFMTCPEGYTIGLGQFCGPLCLRSYSDFDYDLSAADGAAWHCLDCDNHGNEHGFLREWDAVERLGANGHTVSSHLSTHFDSAICCGKCSSYNIQDDNTGLHVNDDVIEA